MRLGGLEAAPAGRRGDDVRGRAMPCAAAVADDRAAAGAAAAAAKS